MISGSLPLAASQNLKPGSRLNQARTTKPRERVRVARPARSRGFAPFACATAPNSGPESSIGTQGHYYTEEVREGVFIAFFFVTFPCKCHNSCLRYLWFITYLLPFHMRALRAILLLFSLRSRERKKKYGKTLATGLKEVYLRVEGEEVPLIPNFFSLTPR